MEQHFTVKRESGESPWTRHWKRFSRVEGKALLTKPSSSDLKTRLETSNECQHGILCVFFALQVDDVIYLKDTYAAFSVRITISLSVRQ